MDIIDKLIKKAQKEFQKVQIQTKGLISAVKSSENRTKLQKDSELEANQAKQSISKNSSELKEAIKGNFANKVSEVFEFLSLKNWYKETDTQFFMLQLNIEHWVWNNEKGISYIEEGIHPLYFEEESKKILNNISKNWRF
ncbi:hypothetical protein VNN41_11210 (plasmid) [Lactococcus garvieae]|uniref:hypothetical protein n=1 Tax=Lactococcus garvieae TaxID=1363 RepID=UPI00311B07BC